MKSFMVVIVLCFIMRSSFAQNLTCGEAVSQLQNYAVQVNQLYQQEYFQTIPNVRCPGYVTNQWGQMVPVNPQLVQNCRWQMLTYLNQWYGQQCTSVNGWYNQIMQGCATNSSRTVSRKPAPRPTSDDVENDQIDTDQIQDLTAGIDEDMSSPIRIPKTPAGYRPSR